MRKIGVFNFATIDGYFEGPEKGQYAWHRHQGDKAEAEQSTGQKEFDSVLLFGRITYEHMVRFWPTEAAGRQFPDMAGFMNKAEKIVFSNTLKHSDWQNTTVIGGDIIEEMRKLKSMPGKDMRILGSGTIVTQLAEAGLIDEFQFMIDPVAIGRGTSLFSGIRYELKFKLLSAKALNDGVVVLTYAPADPPEKIN